MTTNKDLDAMSPEQHAAWVDSLSEVDFVICHTPVGHRYGVVLISLLKRILVTCPMAPGERLELLEQLNAMAEVPISPVALTLIQPACDTAVQMIETAHLLDQDQAEPPYRRSFDVLTSWEVFGHFRRLNPSIDEALCLCFGRDLPNRGRDKTTQ